MCFFDDWQSAPAPVQEYYLDWLCAKKVACKVCEGYPDWKDFVDCSNCNGTGFVLPDYDSWLKTRPVQLKLGI